MPKVVADFNLQPTGKALCHYAGAKKEQNTYLVSIRLPNGVGFAGVRVTEGTVEGFDALIGMDIISQGDFAVTKEDGKTVLSYQCPSVKIIDFVAELKRQKIIPIYPSLDPDEKRKARNKRKKDHKKGK